MDEKVYMFRTVNSEEFWYTADSLEEAKQMFFAEATSEERKAYKSFEVGNGLSLTPL